MFKINQQVLFKIGELDKYSRCAVTIDANLFWREIRSKTISSRHGIWDTISRWAGPDICELCPWESLVKRRKNDELWICGALMPSCRHYAAIMPPLCLCFFLGGGKSTSRGFFAFWMYHFQLLADIFNCSGGKAQSLPVKLVRHGGIIDSWQVGDHRDDWK